MNNNTKNLRASVRAARKAGQSELEYQRPVANYHSNPVLVTKKVAIPRRDKKSGVVTVAKERNMCERVLHNTGEGSKTTASLTVHEPFDKAQPVRFPNHKYMEYSAPRTNRS